MLRWAGKKKVKVIGTQSCPSLCDPHGLYPTRLLYPWNSSGKNNGVGCHFLLHKMGFIRINYHPVWYTYREIFVDKPANPTQTSTLTIRSKRVRNTASWNTLENLYLKERQPLLPLNLCQLLLLQRSFGWQDMVHILLYRVLVNLFSVLARIYWYKQ